MPECGRCGNETHEDELKFNFGVCDGCDQHRDGLRYQQDSKKASNDRAFRTGWSVVKGEEGGSKSWQQMTEEEDSGWHDDPYQCRGCGYQQTPDEWEQKRCKECGTRNTIHPSMR